MLRSLLLKMFQKRCMIFVGLRSPEREREREGDFGCITVTKSVHISVECRCIYYILSFICTLSVNISNKYVLDSSLDDALMYH